MLLNANVKLSGQAYTVKNCQIVYLAAPTFCYINRVEDSVLIPWVKVGEHVFHSLNLAVIVLKFDWKICNFSINQG